MREILLVDDSEMNLAIMKSILGSQYKVYCADSGRAALDILESLHPDLILLDIVMPEMSGTDLMKILKLDKRWFDIPVIFLTALTSEENEGFSLQLGAVDYIHTPVNTSVLLARVKQHIHIEAYRKSLEDIVEAGSSKILDLQNVAINLLAHVTDFRDKYTGYHLKRAEGYVCAIMDNIKGDVPLSYYISESYYKNIKRVTKLHDIGKISIPDAVLLKPGRLSPEEYEIMKTHVTAGAKFLQIAISEFNGPSFLDVALEMVMTHHERWNGTGYPLGLSGEDIPISGRIMAIADVYDALTSKRQYKQAISHNEAIYVIAEGRGTEFDPILTDIFVSIEDKILTISEQFKAVD